MVSYGEVVRLLPPVMGNRMVLVDDQRVSDIVRYVLIAHNRFSGDYEKIARLFDRGSVRETAKEIFSFLKKNVRYVVEGEEVQTVRSPSVLMAMRKGDCKHYAGWIAGIMSQLGYKVRYRFGAYDPSDTDPGHVFVVADEDGRQLWIDPVLSGLDQRSPAPLWYKDKKINDMALEMLSGVGSKKLKRLGVTDNITSSDIDFSKNIPVKVGSDIITNGLYYMILIFGDIPELYTNPPVKFTLDGLPFVLPHYVTVAGTPVPPIPSQIKVEYAKSFQGVPIPDNMIRPVVENGGLYIRPLELGTSGAMTNQLLVQNKNLLLNVLTCAIGPIQNAYQSDPDANRIQRMRIRILENRNTNFLQPKEIKTLAGRILEGMGDAVAVVGKGFVKFIGIIPRNAFLLLVKLNVKGMATALSKNLAITDKAAAIKNKWEGFGGQFDALKDAVSDGAGKKALGTIGEPATAVVSAIAAAAPVIALLAEFLKKIGGPELDNLVDQGVDKMNALLRAAGEDPIGLAEQLGGKPIEVPVGGGNSVIVPPDNNSFFSGVSNFISENPVAVAAAAGLVIFASSKSLRRK